MDTGIDKIMRVAGSQRQLVLMMEAAGYEVARSSVRYWLRAKRVPAERVLALEEVTGVPRYEIRPDLYPPEEYREAG